MMDFVGKEPARTLVRLHCIELEKKTVSCHEIKDPLSDVLRQHLKPTPITNAAAVYAKVLKHPDRSVIIKIGSTSRFRNRINWDKDKDKEKEKNTILTDDNYNRMNDFDNVGIDFYSHWELEYEQVMTEMTESYDA